MMTAAKIVDTVPWIDAKYYAATQTMDEARHTEVFARYIDEKVGDAYPMNPNLEAQITGLLEDSRWDIAYLGMQIVIESLALSAFGDMARRTTEPLLKKLLRYVMADEARHVAFGILSLSEYYGQLSADELKERQDFLLEHTVHARARSTTPEVWERMGVSIETVVPFIIEAASSMESSPFQSFQNGFFAKLVPNVASLGLLDANDGYLRERWGAAGLLEFEFAEDTAAIMTPTTRWPPTGRRPGPDRAEPVAAPRRQLVHGWRTVIRQPASEPGQSCPGRTPGVPWTSRTQWRSRCCFVPDLLTGRVALVTGGATGIGKEICRVLGSHGAAWSWPAASRRISRQRSPNCRPMARRLLRGVRRARRGRRSWRR